MKGQRTPSRSINQRIGIDTLRELFLRIHTICRISPFRYRAWSELRLAAWSCDCLDALRAVKRSVHRKAARAAAQVKHVLPRRIGLQTSAVFLLVEEVPGPLPVCDGDEHLCVMLPDHDLIRDLTIDAGLDLR